jgi:hypothetical protein
LKRSASLAITSSKVTMSSAPLKYRPNMAPACGDERDACRIGALLQAIEQAAGVVGQLVVEAGG